VRAVVELAVDPAVQGPWMQGGEELEGGEEGNEEAG
jgi:hypothetical protein